MWTGDCSFEADNIEDANWGKFLQLNFGISTGLVDVDGKPVPSDFDEQADMCEIIRALVASGKFTGVNDVQIVPISITNEIDCVGEPGIIFTYYYKARLKCVQPLLVLLVTNKCGPSCSQASPSHLVPNLSSN